VCVSTIQGGSGVNTVTDHAVVDIDRRLTPGEDATDAYQELIDLIAERTTSEAVSLEHESPNITCGGLTADENRAWAEEVASAVFATGHKSQLIGVPFGTDAWAIAASGTPTVVFGPGSVDQAHTDDERISIDQLSAATDIFYRIATGG